MNSIVDRLFAISLHFGALGLLLLGVLDDSFLFLPFGNDLLMVALTARNHLMLPIFAGIATAGSVLGCMLLDWVVRKGGKEGLSKIISGRQLSYVKRKVKKRVGWAVAIACVMPPPFPFAGIVAGAAAFQYPRKNLLATIAIGRLARFLMLGLLAIFFGKHVLRWANTPGVRTGILLLLAISVVGSLISVVSWIKRSHAARAN